MGQCIRLFVPNSVRYFRGFLQSQKDKTKNKKIKLDKLKSLKSYLFLKMNKQNRSESEGIYSLVEV